ncbi:nucleosome assembly protein 1-like 1 [Styela clava]|uniref:nucleosome assembly protein 1-like 1 n=1 Tax=Styela clava TaxID=7725 RepID=UPI00193AD48A|nr:nucleosome assembly protein 1-like 1 [Styela clava]
MSSGDAKTSDKDVVEHDEEKPETEVDDESATLNADETPQSMPSASQITAEMMQNPQVLAALQNRIEDMVGNSSGYIESLPKVVKRRIHALKNLQVKSMNIESKFFEEVHELERKYMAIYAPLFDRRRDIIQGEIEPTDSECEWHSEDEEEDENTKENKKNKNEEKAVEDKVNGDEEIIDDIKGIPEFWLTIFKSTDVLQDMIQDHDEPILKSLKDIRVSFSELNEHMAFTLEFLFEPNDYFTNTSLKKLYKLRAQPDDKDPFTFDGPEITSCTGCKIDWKKGKNVTVKTIKKKQKHKGRGTVRTVSKQISNDSFFNFFSPPEVPEDADAELDSDTENLLTSDFEIGHIIRERIVPRAVLYFTGEAQMDYEYDDEEEEEEDEEGHGSGEDTDSENDSDYDPSKDPGTKEQPQECKQQ